MYAMAMFPSMPPPPRPARAAADLFLAQPQTAVDCHFHIFVAHQGIAGARYVPAYSSLLANWQQAAQACGVRRGLLVQPSFLGTDNRLLLQALASPDCGLRGVVVLAPDTAPGMLEVLHQRGVRGVRLNLSGTGHRLAPWAGATGLWDAMAALGWHLELHTNTGELPSVLSTLVPTLPPELTLVLDHFAKPERASSRDVTVQTVARLAQAGRPVYVKLSAAYRLRATINPIKLARYWLAILGMEKLLWGSDWPCTNHEALANFARLRASPDEWLDNAAAAWACLVSNPHRLLV